MQLYSKFQFPGQPIKQIIQPDAKFCTPYLSQSIHISKNNSYGGLVHSKDQHKFFVMAHLYRVGQK